IAEDPAALAHELQKRSAATQTRLLIFIDQLEELVTQSVPAEAAVAAMALSAVMDRCPSTRVLATARSDLLTRLLKLPGLGAHAAGALYPLRPLDREGLREAVVRPAQAAGFAFESEAMIDNLVESTEQAPGGLPLLQFALGELWA